MGIPSDRRFLAVAEKRLAHLFPRLPKQPGYFKRRRKLADTLEWLIGMFASQSPGFHDDLLLIDSPGRVRPLPRNGQALRSSPTPPTTATAARTPATSGASGCTRSSPRTAPPERCSSPRRRSTSATSASGCSTALQPPRRRDAASATRATPAASSPPRSPARRDARPPRREKTSPADGPHLAPIRQRIESIFWTCKDLLTLERHGARTLPGLRERILARFCCLAAAITLNHQLGRPSRALVNYCA